MKRAGSAEAAPFFSAALPANFFTAIFFGLFAAFVVVVANGQTGGQNSVQATTRVRVSTVNVQASVVSIAPEFPNVGEAARLTVSYPVWNSALNSSAQDSVFEYRSSEDVVVEKVSLERVANGLVFIALTLRARHSGIVVIPPVVENSGYRIGIPTITVASSIEDAQKLVELPYPPFPFASLLYLLLTALAALIFLKISADIMRTAVPLGRGLRLRLGNYRNARQAERSTARLQRALAKMEKPGYKGAVIAVPQLYGRLYRALQLRCAFLYGASVTTLTVDEMQGLLLTKLAERADRTKKSSAAARAATVSNAAVLDFFGALTEVLYGGKTRDVKTRRAHCATVRALLAAFKDEDAYSRAAPKNLGQNPAAQNPAQQKSAQQSPAQNLAQNFAQKTSGTRP